jgi:AraC-like DNA-binding protein
VFFVFKECQRLLRRWLREPALRLIRQLTGLRLHVLWHGPLDLLGPGAMAALCPMARQRRSAKDCCESCLRRRWRTTLTTDNQGGRFVGRCGISNFCASVRVERVCPLTLALHATVEQRTQFRRAVALTRLILHDLDSTARAQVVGIRLENASRRLSAIETEVTHLRGELRRRLPGLPESTVEPWLGSHAQRLVDAMLGYVRHHGSRPIGLKDMALAMNMNASYLSTVFSQTTGVTFHHYLEEVRMSKAKELLRDPRNRVGEVACASGYSGLDSFRHAFKAREGVSPEAWRAGA